MGLDAVWSAVADLFWPAICPVCGCEPLEGGDWIHDRGRSRQPLLHGTCLAALRRPSRPAVEAAPWPEGVPLVWAYEDDPAWFRALHSIKYGGRWPLLDLLTSAASLPRPWMDAAVRSPVLVPLPDDPLRRQQRGGSVTGRIARLLARRWECTSRPDLLRRRGVRPPQARLESDTERSRNVRGLFRAGPLASVPADRTLILVEDQVTTGSTLREALPVLGARGHRMLVFSLAAAARAPRELVP